MTNSRKKTDGKRTSKKARSENSKSQKREFSFRLYIADDSPNSVQARSNLQALIKSYPDIRFNLEIVDILEEPLRALAEGVLVTPTLFKLSPAPFTRIIGDLSDSHSLFPHLGIEERKNDKSCAER